MKKFLGVILIVCITISMFAGCNNQPNCSTVSGQPNGSTGSDQPYPPTVPTSEVEIVDYHMPTVDEDFFELVCDNMDVTIYTLSTMQRFWIFQLVSARDLSGETITMTSNLGGTATWTATSEPNVEPVPLSEIVFLGYQDFDWASAKEDPDVLKQQLNLALSSFTDAQNAVPRLYSYRVTVALEDLGVNFGKSNDDRAQMSPQKIETLSITVSGQTKTYTLDNFLLLPESVAQNGGITDAVNSEIAAVTDYAATPSADGILSLMELQYRIKSDVVLQSFTMPGAEVLECEIKIVTSQGDKFSMRWDCNSPLEVDEGSEVTLENLVIRDPALEGTLFSNIYRYLIMHYASNAGEFSYEIPISIRMRQDPFDIYALKVDGVDMLPYYLEYLYYED